MTTNLHELEVLARKVKTAHDGREDEDAAKLADMVLTLIEENAARYDGHIAKRPSVLDEQC